MDTSIFKRQNVVLVPKPKNEKPRILGEYYVIKSDGIIALSKFYSPNQGISCYWSDADFEYWLNMVSLPDEEDIEYEFEERSVNSETPIPQEQYSSLYTTFKDGGDYIIKLLKEV